MSSRLGSPSRLVLAAVALVFPVLAACGSDDDGAATTTSASSTSATSISTSTSSSSTSSSTSTTSTSTSTSTSTTSSTTTTTDATTSTTGSTTSGSTTSTSGSTTTTGRTVEVYFSTGDGTDCSEVTAFERTVDPATGPARAAFQELLGGPTAAEQSAGASSFFSSATADAVRSVSLAGGVLTVDFDDIRAQISNAGTSCGSAAFTSSLNATAFQFPTVTEVRYLFAGSCEDFGGFIQTDRCEFQAD